MDNGSGVAVMMTVMKALSHKKFKNTLCVACFDGEELGLLGSSAIAEIISKDSTLKGNFLGAITSDMSTGFLDQYKTERAPGWTTSNSQFLRKKESDPNSDGIHIDGSEISSSLVDAFGEAALKVVVDKDMPILKSTATLWSSDHKAFLRHSLPAIDICSANHREYEYWHNEHNTTECLTPGIGAEISRTTVAALAKLLEIKGNREGKDLEEDKENIPRFPESTTAQAEFPSMQCGNYAQVFSSLQPKRVSLGLSSKKSHKEVINQLEETIARLEKKLGA